MNRDKFWFAYNVDRTNRTALRVYRYSKGLMERKLKDGRIGTIVDKIGPDYVVDVGEKEEDYETVLVKASDIEAIR